MTTPDSPTPDVIGIFDSGVGGLTVVRAIRDRFPRANLLYLGDTARVPYGTKSAAVVQRYAVTCARFLATHGATQLVIACNTASAYGLDAIRAELDLPVTGVVEPGAAFACEHAPGGAIGVIATEGTIASGSYQNAIRRERPTARILATACPLFVPLAEEGFGESEAAHLIARHYLDAFAESGLESLVLGC
ncbi:MAG: glutamate racemase, partial [Myxococcota bacterium]